MGEIGAAFIPFPFLPQKVVQCLAWNRCLTTGEHKNGFNVGSMNRAFMLAVWKKGKVLAHREESWMEFPSICNVFFSMGHQEISQQIKRREIQVLVNTFKN